MRISLVLLLVIATILIVIPKIGTPHNARDILEKKRFVFVQNPKFIESRGEDYGEDFGLQDKKFLNPNQAAIKDTSLFTHTVVIFYDNLKKEGTCLCLNHAC